MSEKPSSPDHNGDVKKQRINPDTGERVEVVEDEAYKVRLEHLRVLSSELNKTLQRKLEAAHLPFYSWGATKEKDSSRQGILNPKVLRVAVLIRPPFFQSNELKNSSNRYTTSKDQATVFVHVNDDNTIQMLRYHEPVFRGVGAPTVNFSQRLLPDFNNLKDDKRKPLVEQYIARGDMEGLADFIVNRLNPAVESDKKSDAPDYTKKIVGNFQRAYKLVSKEDCQRFFSEEHFLYEHVTIVKNLAKIALVSILETQVDLALAQQKKPDSLKDNLERKAAEFLDLEVNLHPEKQKIRFFIPDAERYVKDVIHALLKEVRAVRMGKQ